MKLVDRGEILGLAEYETVRERFRARVIGEKKLRRVQLGPRATAVFENHDTMLMQIQEMLRTERITRPAAVQHEIDTYNEIVPAADELSCTVMIEIVDKAERDAFLQAALGFEKHVWFVAGERVPAYAPRIATPPPTGRRRCTTSSSSSPRPSPPLCARGRPVRPPRLPSRSTTRPTRRAWCYPARPWPRLAKTCRTEEGAATSSAGL